MKKLLALLLLTVCCAAQVIKQPPPTDQQRALSLPAFVPQYLPPYPALAGLKLYVSGGNITLNNQKAYVASQYIYLQANTTTWAYVDLTLGVLSSNHTGFPGNTYPVAVVTTNGTMMTNLTDARPDVFGGGTSGGGSASWGSITGTLSTQTDLQNALNLKVTIGGNPTTNCIGMYTGPSTIGCSNAVDSAGTFTYTGNGSFSGNMAVGGTASITSDTSIGGNLNMTGAGGFQWNGKLLGSTTISVSSTGCAGGQCDYAFGVGSDSVFRCILSGGSSCLSAGQLTGTLNTGVIPDLSATYLTQAELNAINGVAPLDSTGKLPVGNYQSFLPQPLPNDPGTGTGVGLLATQTSSGNAVTISTTTAYGIIGPCQSGCGTANTAILANDGVGVCVFDNGTNSGDVVVPSTTVAGNCHDTGSTSPSPWLTQVGNAVSTNASAGTYSLRINVTNPSDSIVSFPNESSGGTIQYSLAKLVGTGGTGVTEAANMSTVGSWASSAVELTPSGANPPAFVGSATASSSGTGTSTGAVSYSPTNGNGVVVIVSLSGLPGGGGNIACVDSGSNSVAHGTGINQSVFIQPAAYKAGAGITSFTCTWTTARNWVVGIYEYSGVSTVNLTPTNNTASCPSACSNPASISPLYSVAQDRMIAGFSRGVANNTWSVVTGTLRTGVGSHNPDLGIVENTSAAGAPNAAKILLTSDLRTAGVAINGVGTSGTVTLVNQGIAPCNFDTGGVTINHFVQISTVTAGDCADAGASRPISGQILGIVNSATTGGAGLYQVYFFGPDDQSSANSAVQYGYLTSAMTAQSTATPTTVTGMSWTINASKEYQLSCHGPITTAGSATIAFDLNGTGSPTSYTLSAFGLLKLGSTLGYISTINAASWATATSASTNGTGATSTLDVFASINNNTSTTLTLRTIADGTHNITMLADWACILTQLN